MAVSNHERINALIEETTDPSARAMLLVLSAIVYDLENNNVSLKELTGELASHRAEFRDHDKREVADRAMIRGAWWAGVLLFSVVQVVGGWIVSRAIADNDAQGAALIAQERRLGQIELTLKLHDSRQTP